jgi:hypothetical protein
MFYMTTFRSVRACVCVCECAMPSTAIFCSSLMSCFQSMLPTYFLNNSETVSPLFFTIHMRRIYIWRSLYCRILSTSLSQFCSLNSQLVININAPFLLPLITICSLFLGMVCQFALDDDIIWLPQLHALFPPLSVHVHTSFHCPVLLQLRDQPRGLVVSLWLLI